jgi:hypothetical protein
MPDHTASSRWHLPVTELRSLAKLPSPHVPLRARRITSRFWGDFYVSSSHEGDHESEPDQTRYPSRR